MPGWFKIFESMYPNQAKLQMPILRLCGGLLLTFGPYYFGYFIGSKYSKNKEKFNFILRPVIYFILFTIFFGLFNAKYNIFDFTTYTIIGISLIPWMAFLITGFIGYIFELEQKNLFTISLSGGLKNISVAFLIINTNFSSPESDYGVPLLLNLLLIGQLPIYFWPFIYRSYIEITKFYNCYTGTEETGDEFDYMSKNLKKRVDDAEIMRVVKDIWGEDIIKFKNILP